MKQEMDDVIIVGHLKKTGLYEEFRKQLPTKKFNRDCSFVHDFDLYIYNSKPGDSGWVWFHAESMQELLLLPIMQRKIQEAFGGGLQGATLSLNQIKPTPYGKGRKAK